MHEFPRRVRATFGGQTVFDTTRAVLLHETGLPPQVYVPLDDIRADLIPPTDHHTYCPFKGTASYWTVTRRATRRPRTRSGPTRSRTPRPQWLKGYAGFYWNAMDEWYDEDERIEGHLRDPYHRVDVRRSAHARSASCSATRCWPRPSRPLLLSETGLPNRFYIPAEDVRQDLLEPSDTHTDVPVQGHRLVLVGQRRTAASSPTPSGPTRRPRATPPRSAATCPSCTTT